MKISLNTKYIVLSLHEHMRLVDASFQMHISTAFAMRINDFKNNQNTQRTLQIVTDKDKLINNSAL